MPAQALDFAYYDTVGRDLAVRHITLRRCTGGADPGWHLTLPTDSPTVLRASLDDEVPAELRDVVLAIVRDRPLAVVARISTTRTVDCLYGADGTPLAEFADEELTAWADGREADRWREWRLELSSYGHRELLDRLTNRLLDAGAHRAGEGSTLARVLDGPTSEPLSRVVDDPVHRAVAEEVENLLVWDRAVRADVDDSVHQMRVTTRKIRSLLQASESAFGLSDDAWVLDELRQLASVLGIARDAEVLAARYQKALDELPAELVRGPVRERLVEGSRRRYRSGWRKSVAAMRSQRYFRLLDALEGLVAAELQELEPGSEQPSDTTVASGYERVRKRAKETKKAQAEHRDEALHRIRKAAKRLRYTAGATGDTKIAGAAKDIQSLLGDHQDSVVSRTYLSQQADAAHAAREDTFTYGLLYEREGELARQSREQLAPALKALKKAARKEL
jgi:CHAD domain-containing protein